MGHRKDHADVMPQRKLRKELAVAQVRSEFHEASDAMNERILNARRA